MEVVYQILSALFVVISVFALVSGNSGIEISCLLTAIYFQLRVISEQL